MIMTHLVLPGMKDCKKGCIINIASRSEVALSSDLIDRAGTVTGPMAVHYFSSKAALIRATGCIQAELNIQGYDDIHLYALHPGACRTSLQSEISFVSR